MNRRGNTVTAVLISLGIVGASVALFFAYTKGKIGKDVAGDGGTVVEGSGVGSVEKVGVGGGGEALPEVPGGSSGAETLGSSEVPAGEGSGPEAAVDPEVVVAALRFETSAALAGRIGKQILDGDYAGAAELISGEKEGAATFAEADEALRMIFKERALKADPGGFGEIGQTVSAHRYGMKLAAEDGTEAGRIVMDLTRDVKLGWKVETIEVPKEIAVALSKVKLPGVGDGVVEAAGAESEPGGGLPSKRLVVEERTEDALAAAESFVASLLRQNYDEARKTADFQRVSSEKIAGLCIVFEEGEYKMRESKPLIATAAQEESAWVIVRLAHASGNGAAEFGIELERGETGWKVVALNLSKLLAAFTEREGVDGIAYVPMVASPQGGQSIALYFEFDDAAIHPRAGRQLEIISKVLKGDASKTLKITGHTDKLGEEDYNVRLSQDRAANVKARLLELGVNVEQIVTMGAGDTMPLRPNEREDGTDDPEARSHNRRAEIFLDF